MPTHALSSKALCTFSPSNPVGEAISFVAAFAVGALLNLVLKRFWHRAYGHEAPMNPSQPGVKWGEALTWGLVTGAAAGAAKVIARRGTDIAQRKFA
jgi:hypothetical protein